MTLGYAYPAYECYKTVEKNKPEIEQLRFWCQYWILVAVLTVCERVGYAFVSWVPMYSEAKLLFVIYLWFPKTKGTSYVYDSFFRPYLAKHENEIDRNLLELRTRAGDMYVAAQSTPRPRPTQPQQGVRSQPPADPAPNRQPAATTQAQPEEPPSHHHSTVAPSIHFQIADGVTKSVPCSCIEFAERLVLPQYSNLPLDEVKEHHRRDRFEVGNADKIFESTSKEQLTRKAA
ncbi:putative HVA22-like protein g [Malus domestica]|uniref:putative HVA22-like protein g n=1 Tax=Malus domestica TaxID=3750 RepID=UPI0039759791